MTTPRFVGVIDEEPFDVATWSGSSRYFFCGLKEHGALASAFSAELPKASRLVQIARNFRLPKPAWRFAYHINPAVSRARTEIVRAKMASVDPESFDCAVQVGAWYDVSQTTDKPVVSYHDGNLAAKLDNPYGTPHLPRRRIRAALQYEKALYTRMSAIFTMSNWLARSFRADFGMSNDKVHAVGAGINLPRILDTKGRNYDSKQVLFVGKDFSRKGGPVLLEAFRKVRRNVPASELVIVGPTLNIDQDGVTCAGFINKSTEDGLETMLNLYKQAAVFVLPSLYEPFGISLVEAMAHRTPCVAVDNCAMPEIVDHERTGLIVPVNDADALADALIELLQSPADTAAMGEAGFAKYENELNWNAVTRRIIDTVGKIL